MGTATSRKQDGIDDDVRRRLELNITANQAIQVTPREKTFGIPHYNANKPITSNVAMDAGGSSAFNILDKRNTQMPNQAIQVTPRETFSLPSHNAKKPITSNVPMDAGGSSAINILDKRNTRKRMWEDKPITTNQAIQVTPRETFSLPSHNANKRITSNVAMEAGGSSAINILDKTNTQMRMWEDKPITTNQAIQVTPRETFSLPSHNANKPITSNVAMEAGGSSAINVLDKTNTQMANQAIQVTPRETFSLPSHNANKPITSNVAVEAGGSSAINILDKTNTQMANQAIQVTPRETFSLPSHNANKRITSNVAMEAGGSSAINILDKTNTQMANQAIQVTPRETFSLPSHNANKPITSNVAMEAGGSSAINILDKTNTQMANQAIQVTPMETFSIPSHNANKPITSNVAMDARVSSTINVLDRRNTQRRMWKDKLITSNVAMEAEGSSTINILDKRNTQSRMWKDKPITSNVAMEAEGSSTINVLDKRNTQSRMWKDKPITSNVAMEADGSSTINVLDKRNTQRRMWKDKPIISNVAMEAEGSSTINVLDKRNTQRRMWKDKPITSNVAMEAEGSSTINILEKRNTQRRMWKDKPITSNVAMEADGSSTINVLDKRNTQKRMWKDKQPVNVDSDKSHVKLNKGKPKVAHAPTNSDTRSDTSMKGAIPKRLTARSQETVSTVKNLDQSNRDKPNTSGRMSNDGCFDVESNKELLFTRGKMTNIDNHTNNGNFHQNQRERKNARENNGTYGRNRTNFAECKSENNSNNDTKRERNNQQENNQNFNLHRIGYPFLKALLEKDPCEIILKLTEKQIGFNVLLCDEKLRPDLLVLIIKVLAEACEADFNENKSNLLTLFCHGTFIDTLKIFLCKLPFEEPRDRYSHKEFWNDVNGFWSSLFIIYYEIINLLPNTACDRLKSIVDATSNCIDLLEKQKKANLSVELKTAFEEMQIKFILCIEERERKKETVKRNNDRVDCDPPPNNFRTISIYPGPEDLFSKHQFLRPNIIKGCYLDVEHYLDVQYRLLREDFVAPLREGIEELIGRGNNQDNKKRRMKNSNIRMYKKTKMLGPKINRDTVGIVVDFEAGNRDEHGRTKPTKYKVMWESSKRLMYGSLLCFTADNFAHIIFATVAERDVKELAKGLVIVQLCQEEDMQVDMYQKEYLMIENEVYFEPYFHVLKTLQVMNEENFPMKKYIVDVQPETSPPQYLVPHDEHVDVDDEVVIIPASDVFYVCDDIRFKVLQINEWPYPNQLQLDQSQYNAFQTALTKEFAIIQGPPGTGKTYLGLKVASVLLQNLPTEQILVVCYTNHALDQFLEGLIPFTKRIARVGNQSKTEALNQFNLRNLRNKRSFAFGRVFHSVKRDLDIVMHELKRKVTDMEMCNANDGIIDMSQNIYAKELQENPHWLPKVPENVAMSPLAYWLLGIDQSFRPQMIKNIQIVENNDNREDEIVDLNEEGDDIYRPRIERDVTFDEFNDAGILKYDVTISGLKERIAQVVIQIGEPLNFHTIYEMNKLEIYRREIVNACDHLEYRMNIGDTSANVKFVKLPNQLDFNGRWALYWFWLKQWKEALLKEITALETRYKTLYKQYEELRHIEDLEVLKTCQIIGMTTTSSARLHSLLQALKTPIVIIEEAAEVAESHIIASLTRYCQHLILIGDHQQLRPSTSVYRLAKHFNLDISLFERMLKNGVHCARLGVQHRMRPEIASLISPNIYEDLQNDSSVLEYPPIKGVTKSMFFIMHTEFEDPEVGDSVTRRNKHEAQFMIRLCRYLILQGYEGQDITLLTAYTGQMFYIRSERKKYNILQDVKITVVDNYQGEENKIILLSLVRSNEEAKIGFLGTENRVCVALSRAKEGLFIIGNLNNLTQSSQIWPKIQKTLQNLNAVDTHLTLQCRMHPDKLTRVSCADDFNMVPEGGCNQLCMALLICGHECSSVCHILDRKHEEYNCKEKCTKVICQLNHPCTKFCYQDCGKCYVRLEKTLKCSHKHTMHCCQKVDDYPCPTLVLSTLPPCNHSVMKPCHCDASSFQCPEPCEDRLPCGHKCVNNCHKLQDPDHLQYICNKPCPRLNKDCSMDHNCSKLCKDECAPCGIQIKKNRVDCSHAYQVACSVNVNLIPCERKCKRILPCGHFCKLYCSDPCGNCKIKVEKQVPECGHTVKIVCKDEPTLKHCEGPCAKILRCGHKCQNKCKQTCTDKCEVLIDKSLYKIKAICGHHISLPCHLLKKDWSDAASDLLRFCKECCPTILSCGHRCKGSCFECLQGRIHKPCGEPCGNVRICQHSCTIPCREVCPPCDKNCTYKCQHSKCPKKCGEPCTPCTEPCSWTCIHAKCTKRCGDMCDKLPCKEPCPKHLQCGHLCIGFCGEECPPKCRVCDKDEVTSIFFGDEDEENARFVKLLDCPHFFEVTGLEQWFATDIEGKDKEICLKVCPSCKTPISTTPMFGNAVKTVYRDIIKVKRIVFGNKEENEQARTQLETQIQDLISNSIQLHKDSREWKSLIQILLRSVQVVHMKRRQILNKTELQTIAVSVEICTQIYMSYQDVKDLAEENRIPFVSHVNKIINTLLNTKVKITTQHVNDIYLELSRIHWIAQLCKIYNSVEYNMIKDKSNVININNECRTVVFGIHRFVPERVVVTRGLLKNLAKSVDCAITDERKMIVNTMGLKQGHWYKCCNGHIYCIDACGGAMQESKCPECGDVIGGTNHRLRAGNSVATEMDGATRPAWPQ